MQLIFIHGSGGCKEAWDYQMQHFEGSIALNLPGHPEGALCPAISDYVQWLHNFVLEKQLHDLVLIGHSLGGGIALLYALTYPQEIKGIVTVGSGARLRVHPDTLAALAEAVKNPAIFVPGNTYEFVAPEFAEILTRRRLENGAAAMLNDMRACDKFDIMERIGEIKTPTLALCGDKDDMTPPKYSHYLAARMPNAKAVVIEGGTHMLFAEKPVEVNTAIDDFLKTLA